MFEFRMKNDTVCVLLDQFYLNPGFHLHIYTDLDSRTFKTLSLYLTPIGLHTILLHLRMISCHPVIDTKQL